MSEKKSQKQPDAPAAESAPIAAPEEFVVEGILVLDAKGNGSLRSPRRRGKAFPTDPFIPKEIVKRFKMKTGSWIVAKAQQKKGHANAKISYVESIDGINPNERHRRPQFQNLTAHSSDTQLVMETKDGRLTNRVIDLFCPIGKGQRGLIAAPPRTGKTTLLKDIALGVRENYPDVKVMVLLVDERPEEVTDFARDLPEAELYASSNDESAKTHIAIAEICIERARRLAEVGQDVVLLIDSLTLIDMLADRAGIDPDEPEDKESVTKQNQNPGEKYVIYMDGILKYSTNSFDKCKEVFEDLCEHTDCNLMMYEWGKVIGSRGVRKHKK